MRQMCAVRVGGIALGESPLHFLSNIQPLLQYQRHEMIVFYALVENTHSSCWQRPLCYSIFTSALSQLPSVACGQTAVLPWFWSTDVGVYNETSPQTPPTLWGIYIHLLSLADPEVIRQVITRFLIWTFLQPWLWWHTSNDIRPETQDRERPSFPHRSPRWRHVWRCQLRWIECLLCLRVVLNAVCVLVYVYTVCV